MSLPKMTEQERVEWNEAQRAYEESYAGVAEVPTITELIVKTGAQMNLGQYMDWKNSPDSEWVFQDVYISQKREKFLGVRNLGECRYAVFLAMDESFIAQKYEGEVNEEDVFTPEFTRPKQMNPAPLLDFSRALKFVGTNWKLAGRRKWSPIMPREKFDNLEFVTTYPIFGVDHKIFKSGIVFIAFPT